MPNLPDTLRPTKRIRRRVVLPRVNQQRARKLARWRAPVAMAAVLLLYIVGLVIAAPLGGGAVAVTVVLALVVTIFVGGRIGNRPVSLRRSSRGGHRVE
jgi:AcrR family transcriptional regulator